MKKNLIAAITPAVYMLVVATANAQTHSFEGFYVQGAIGYENASPSIDSGVIRSTGGAPPAGTYNPTFSLQSKSYFDYSIGVGYGVRVGTKTILTFGANLNPQSQDYQAQATLPGFVISPGTVTLKDRNHFFIAPGYEVDSKSLIYGKLGVASAKMEGPTGLSVNLNGIIYGIGYKTFFNKNLYAYGEFNATNYGKTNLTSSGVTYTGTFSADYSATATNFLVGVGYKF